MNNQNEQKGFSLVELLIVIAIIILLGLISVIALNDQRAKARDSKRISDIRQIMTALEFYHSDNNEYPAVTAQISLGKSDAVKLCSKAIGGFVSAQTPCDEKVYMPIVPADPLGDKSYLFSGSASGYDIVFTTEKPSSLGEPGVYHAHSEGIDKKSGNR